MLKRGLLYGLLALLMMMSLQNRLILAILLLLNSTHHRSLLLLLSGHIVFRDMALLSGAFLDLLDSHR